MTQKGIAEESKLTKARDKALKAFNDYIALPFALGNNIYISLGGATLVTIICDDNHTTTV